MAFRLTSIGEVLWDVFPEGPRFGGAPANVASHAAAMGLEATMVSRVGEDDFGTRAIEELRKRQVNTDYVSKVSGVPTGMVNVAVDDAGKPQFTIQDPAAWDQLVWSDQMRELAKKCDAVCFGTLGQRHDAARNVIQKFVEATPAKALRVCDVNLRPPFVDDQVIRRSLEIANVLKLSDDELEVIVRAARCTGSAPEVLAELLDNWGLHLIVLTRGSRGAMLVTNDERSDCDGYQVEIEDTVGAGDSFTAAMICGMLLGKPLDVINEKACRIAAYVCSQPGATPQLPEELVKWA